MALSCHLLVGARQWSKGTPICFASGLLLMAASDFPTRKLSGPPNTLGTIEPFKPVRPAGYDPIDLIDRSRTALDQMCRGHKKSGQATPFLRVLSWCVAWASGWYQLRLSPGCLGDDDCGSIYRVALDGCQCFIGVVQSKGRYPGLKIDLGRELEKVAGIRAGHIGDAAYLALSPE
jgi:hypothetical protein